MRDKTSALVRALSITVIVGTLLHAGVWEVNADDSRKLRYHIYSAKALRDIGDHVGAAEEFRAAYDLTDDVEYLYEIAASEAAAKRYGVALTAFQRYLATVGDGIGEARAKTVADEVERLQLEVGYLDIEVLGSADITIDGLPRGEGEDLSKLPVTANVEHVVVSEGIHTKTVTVRAWETVTVDLLQQEVERQATGGLKLVGWVLTAGGAAVVAAGGVTGGLALKEDMDLVRICDGAECAPKHESKIDRRDKLAMMTNVLWAVGGAAVTAGIIMLIVAPDGEERAVEVGAMPAPGGGSAVLTWEF